MTPDEAVPIRDKDGLHAIVEANQLFDVTRPHVVATMDSGETAVIARDVLVEQKDGSFYLPASLSDLKSRLEEGESVTMPVIEEERTVQKRTITTGKVIVSKTVEERDVLVDERLMQQRVDVERVPVNRYVDGPVEVRYEGDTMIVPLLEEVLVIEKRLMLREEVRITRREGEIHDPQHVVLRREQVGIEREESPTVDNPDTP